MKIAVIGTGYVGLVAGTCLAESGRRVTCVDVDESKVALLRSGGVPIYEPGLEELIRRNARSGRLDFTTSVAEAMEGTDVAFIAVGTPPGETGEADLQHVLAAARQIGSCLSRYTVVVNKSTVPVGSAEKVAEAVRAVAPPGAEFDVVSNPEFLKEGAAIEDFMRPDRVIVGVGSERARAAMAELYEPFMRTEQRVLFMDLRSAELTKYAANAMLATRISFMNDVAMLCDRLGADVDAVRRGVGSDGRIGNKFLFPGVGFGGSCLAGDETVLVRQDGRARLVALESLFDALAIACDEPPAGAAALRPEGLEVLAWAPGRPSAFLPVAYVTRNTFRGEAMVVRTKLGRRVRCTPDHPFFVSDRSGRDYRVKAASELGPDDWLPLAIGQPAAHGTGVRTLDLLTAAELGGIEAANVLVHPAPAVADRLVAQGAGALGRALAPLEHRRGSVTRARDALRAGTLRLDEVAVAGVSLAGASASTVKNGTRVPVSLAADEAFWRVVGLYLAEGHCTADGRRRRLTWSFHPRAEEELVAEVAGFWRRLGVKADVRSTGTARAVSVSSRLLASLFLEVLELGSDCYSHRIPDLAWSEPERHQRALLSGLWQGDGSWSLVNGGPSAVLEWGTASAVLADGVARLLGALGVTCRTKVGRTARSTVDNHWIVVSGADQIERLLELVKASDRRGVLATLRRQARRTAPTGCARVEGGALVRVTAVEREPYSGSVYSLEVPGAHTFVTTGGLVAHNCFPKDLQALMTMARQVGLDFDVLRSVDRVNERQKRLLFDLAQKHMGSVAGKRVGVWGLAFKPRTDDMREATSRVLIQLLSGAGAEVLAHDPVAGENAARLLGPHVKIVGTPYEAAQGADALFLVTEWQEFRSADYERLAQLMRGRFLFDGRNAWDPQKARAAGFRYFGVGRGRA